MRVTLCTCYHTSGRVLGPRISRRCWRGDVPPTQKVVPRQFAMMSLTVQILVFFGDSVLFESRCLRYQILAILDQEEITKSRRN